MLAVMEPPEAGEVIELELGGNGDLRCTVTGFEASVRFEYSRIPSVGPRKVHLVREPGRNTPELWHELRCVS